MAILALAGKISSGKDTVADIIKKIDAESDWKIKKFASKLKEIATILTRIPSEMFENQDFKKTYLGNEWDLTKKTDHTLIENGKAASEYVKSKMTVRDLLQKIGTEAMRNGLHPDTWVNALFADYKPVVKEWDELGNDTLVQYPNWIITDMRFPNEMQAVKANGGITIRVVRPSDKEIPLDLHPSETALDDAEFDYEIINDGTIEDLKEKVEGIILHINLNK
jgi:hypothetical protein